MFDQTIVADAEENSVKGLYIENIQFQGDGSRPGGLLAHIRAGALPTHSYWQDVVNNREVRLIKDGVADAYVGIAGVTVLQTRKAIQNKLDIIKAALPTAVYAINNSALLAASIAAKKIDLSSVPNTLSAEALAQRLYELGALGIAVANLQDGFPTIEEMMERFSVVDS